MHESENRPLFELNRTARSEQPPPPPPSDCIVNQYIQSTPPPPPPPPQKMVGPLGTVGLTVGLHYVRFW